MSKIFHIISNNEWGGGEQYVFDLAQRQKADGISVTIFCKPVPEIVSKCESVARVIPLRLNGVTDIISAYKMAKVVKHEGQCVIHAHNFKDAFTACYARELSGNKQIRVVMCRHLTRKGKNSFHYRWLYKHIDAICFDSQLSRDMFMSTNPSIDESKLSIVRTSIVVPQHVEPASLREELGIPSTEVLAMYHGRLDPEKGIDTLLDAVARLKADSNISPFRLVLIGKGSKEYTAHLQESIKAKSLEGTVILAGFRHPVLPYVASSDFGILASIVREGCPLSPQEYMSQGRPVVTTDNGGQKEYVVNGENGFMVTPGDAERLAEAMSVLINDAEKRQQMGMKAKEDFFDHMDYEHFYVQIKKLYGSYL